MPLNENIMKSTPCIKLTRSKSSLSNFNCDLGYREQINQHSAFIDGTQIYGINEKRSQILRANQRGQLNSNPGINARSYLPQTNDPQCRDQFEDKRCFAAGESRLNENLALVGVQLLFMREHNRIANILADLNPFWSDERTFNETRRILIAIYQHIVYKEYIPVIIGKVISEKFDLQPLNAGFYKEYNSNFNPSISNEFATAAFRFGHTLVII